MQSEQPSTHDEHVDQWNMRYHCNNLVHAPMDWADEPIKQDFNICGNFHIFLQKFSKKHANVDIPSPGHEEQAYLSAKECVRIAKTMHALGEEKILEECREMIPDIVLRKYRRVDEEIQYIREIFHRCQGLQIKRYCFGGADARDLSILYFSIKEEIPVF